MESTEHLTDVRILWAPSEPVRFLSRAGFVGGLTSRQGVIIRELHPQSMVASWFGRLWDGRA
jgi:hypothetical protein